jgi:alkylation response protein AidB-like acyl-CoA dehydrogenase
MDFRFTPAQEEFRKEFVSWVEKNLPDGWGKTGLRYYKTQEDLKQAYKNFQKRLFDAGYAAMHYPEEYGGQGKTLMEEIIVLQTISTTCIELRMPGVVTHGMAVPVIFTCGTEEHKKKFLPKILDGTHIWCQGFSEPDAGSDVANVSTMAIKEGDRYIVNGQKVWTSYAHISDYCLLLVRTDPDSAKHKGLSYLLVDMKAPGVDVRPMTQITGESEFNEIFFDDVEVPVDMLVGQENMGWQIAITTLMFERVMGDVVIGAAYEKNLQRMINMAGNTKRSGRPVIENPVFRQQLAQSYIEIMALKYHGLRSFSHQLKGGIPGPEGSIGKLLWSEPNQRLTEAALGMQGPNSQIMGGSDRAIDDGLWQYAYLRSKGNTIEAGTSEIQRNIIGERVLGLPKDMSRAKIAEGGKS